jgi:hypothetical protein
VQQPVGVDLAQTVHHQMKDPPDVPFGNHHLGLAAAPAQDQLLERAALLEGHHHVDGFVGPEEIHHAHDVRVQDARQRPPFFEEALQAVAIGVQVLRRDHGHEFAGLALDQGAGQVFLDGVLSALGILRQVDNGKSTAGDLI